ncbi:dinucleotide-utilizing enzyme possibly involved in molybdopterin or thiamin biosynthesis [Methanomethylovorans hollandica DSM 15978]|uniref:Dinucleotide-utilizing enzyme possibly involved in molybdopterin or thiamin biosynthesis n=1 Tax=Methanomethylovorans hollandica (strain DSM 15978 / NBRC 107637 / DMS1) TaxID=867904 RepID=L0L0B2_METHD|nr:HesA/MoeB/ThiF family protein [Methanomethylovorans hollandica]AGB49788.1 dinucleotide-utilizing enzyme possibly involved in molybdopterin or thiamin biosynthesis [Methanomethylovorans hollandica DSM 15978]
MLNEQELQRYQRQLLMFDKEGQEKLKQSRVFIAGGGGLGCPIALYLAVAGVGCIDIADMDAVEQTNLNRQVLHWEKDIGKPKVLSIKEKIRQINPYINIIARHVTITEENVLELVRDADIIVDALDNFSARYLLNHASLQTGIPLVHGAIRGFDGQLMTIIPGKTACLKCVFPHAPPEEVFPVIGVTPGIIGTIQANEVLKYLLQTGEPLEGLLVWDGLNAKMDSFKIQRRNKCEACGDPDL